MSPVTRLNISVCFALLCLAPVCLAALVSCQSAKGTAEATASPDAIAEIYGQPVTAAQFSAYVAGITPSSADQTPEPNEAELMSRLLDRFLDEELILREAGRKGMAVTEREVTEALRRLHRPEGGEGGRPQETADSGAPPDAPAARERMRRALLVRKFREEKILNGLTVGPGEIGSWYDEHKEEFSQPAHVVLRQILLDDPAAAKKTRDDLVKDPNRFEEIAQALSMAPDGGRAQAYAEADLAPDIVAAAAAVPDGGITEVVGDSMGSRIFRVEKRQPARVIGVEEASKRIQVALMQQKGKKRYDDFMEKVRQEAALVIHEERLPFGYRRRAS